MKIAEDHSYGLDHQGGSTCALAASVERESEHYIPVELRNRAQQAGFELVEPAAAKIFDSGITGLVNHQEIRIGSSGFLKEEIARFVFGGEIRQEASAVIRALQAMNLQIYLVSGNGEEATKAVGQEVEIREWHGGVSRLDESAFIGKLQSERHNVAMVGDGINDAPALAQAHLGFGLSSGRNLGQEMGGVTLMREDLTQILDFLMLAKRVNRKIRQNILLSGLYNIMAIPVAMSGRLNPLVAVPAMLLSSLSVIGNTLLLIKRSR